MHLRRGVTAQRAIEVIEEQISASQGPLNVAEGNPDLKRHSYLNWVADTEVRLQEIFSDAGTEDPLLDRGYWHICSTSSSDERLMSRLMREKLRFQAGILLDIYYDALSRCAGDGLRRGALVE